MIPWSDPLTRRATEADSLVDLLRRRASEDPTAELFSFLPDGEAASAIVLSRGELDRRARALASRLHDRGLAGERALLLYPPGLEFIAAFFGCLYARVVAVPAYLPRPNRPMDRLRSIVADARPAVVLTCCLAPQRLAAVGLGSARARRHRRALLRRAGARS